MKTDVIKYFAVALAVTRVVAADVNKPDVEHRWWPVQVAPKCVVRTGYDSFRPVTNETGAVMAGDLSPDHMLATSLAGLTAMAVNEGRFKEMVWISLWEKQEAEKSGAPAEYAAWFKQIKGRLHLKDNGLFTPMQLLERYKNRGVYDGYILYRFDRSKGGVTKFRDGSDKSVNVAASLAGVMKGVLISEEQEEQAKKLGLKLLFDARGKTEQWLFDNYRDKLNRHAVLAQDPQMPQNRDIAIANRMMVLYGMDAPTPAVYDWLEPGSAVLGWNGPDEFGAVEQMSLRGHVLLPCNWALNLAFLSAGSERVPAQPFKSFDPGKIDWSGTSNVVSFVMSDGDNVQWMLGDFCRSPYYWASPDHGKFPFGWGMPFACLDQVSPVVYDYLRRTQPNQVTLILNTGYFYPDRFGANFTPERRREILTQQSRRVTHYLKRAGQHTFMFLCHDFDSPAALEAYQVFAREIDDLTGMFVIQFAPYEAGNGKVMWVRNRRGMEIPVVSAKYCIWANNQPGSGPPAKIARLINEESRRTAAESRTAPFWVMTHAWSGFVKHDGPDEKAENGRYQAPGTEAGVTPTRWCVERLDKNVKVVSPEELLWRIRMAHDSATTKAEIARFRH